MCLRVSFLLINNFSVSVRLNKLLSSLFSQLVESPPATVCQLLLLGFRGEEREYLYSAGQQYAGQPELSRLSAPRSGFVFVLLFDYSRKDECKKCGGCGPV